MSQRRPCEREDCKTLSNPKRSANKLVNHLVCVRLCICIYTRILVIHEGLWLRLVAICLLQPVHIHGPSFNPQLATFLVSGEQSTVTRIDPPPTGSGMRRGFPGTPRPPRLRRRSSSRGSHQAFFDRHHNSTAKADAF